MSLHSYGTRTQMMTSPPLPAPSASTRWTGLYLVSNPLPANISIVQFDITSHDQGWCTNPQGGVWSWFEVSILGSWMEDANPDLQNLLDEMSSKSSPDDFGKVFQEQGLYFKDIPGEKGEGSNAKPAVRSVLIAKNAIQWDWQHHTITWTRDGSNGSGSRVLPLIEEGDRLAIWARTQFPGWMNFVKEIHLKISTDLSPRTSLELQRRMQREVHTFPDDILSLAMLLNNLGKKRFDQFWKTGRMEDLEASIRYLQQAVKTTPRGHPSLANHLEILSSQLKNRFDLTGRIEDLDESIRLMQQAVDITSGNQLRLAINLSNLGILFHSKFECQGLMENLEAAIRHTQKAVNITPNKHPELASHLCNLAVLLQRRFEWTGRIEDSEEAIRRTQQAVNITPQDHKNLALSLRHLGLKLMDRFKRTGSIEDLEESIGCTQRAVNITPPDHPDLADCLCDLGQHLLDRFVMVGRMEDLEESIRSTQKAVDITPQGHPRLAVYLQVLGNQLRKRFDRIGRMEDLEESIQRMQEAVDITPQGNPNLAGNLSMLGTNLSHRFERTCKMEDLEKSIQYSQQAINLTPQGHPSFAGQLNNLSIVLKSRFESIGRMEYLEEAIKKAQKAVNIPKQDSSQFASLSHNLGRFLSLSPRAEHQEQLLQCFRQAWDCRTGMPFIRVDSALEAIRLLKQRRDWFGARKIAIEAIDMLSRMNNRSLSRDDQRIIASRFSGLAGNACSLSLQCNGDAIEALNLVELGRGVIVGLLMDDRSDISALSQSHPEKAAAFDRLRSEVNMPVNEDKDLDVRRHRMTRRLEAVKELEETISIIRRLEGFERFLLGPTLDELKKQATEGPIVVVNVTDIRSDAIIVSQSAVKSVRLPQLTDEDTKKWLNQELTTYRNPQERGKKNKRYLEFLRWLWSNCVEIILLEVQSMQKPDPGKLPSIWWIGIGSAYHLPFHAAGIHSDGSTENTLSWAISSYTPTIKALAHAREMGAMSVNAPGNTPKLLVVTMPTTPGERDLPGVESEEAAIKMATRSAFSIHMLHQPHAKMVREKLAQCDMLHFAGHGVSDYNDPFKSRLLLQECHGGVTRVDDLSVQDIFDLDLKRARIAYLSACSTAEIRPGRMVDEVIHLASGFQVAGFSHVIASMWQTDDDACEKMARGFYGHLKQTMEEEAHNRAVAVAAHKAMMEIRSKWMRFPLLWAPYVHFGA
ncbi:hypothetical protein N7520_002714 [Penicillium odoratum]|uniref:uncharacterized protein n=1 Tax=Penicillium odoratum TaxID=1167516 RepID=UPI002548A043|nr:uncharacterized protein N7520_002714 [Penicillium odoratum]KAJ5772185.1 hypothetical protein N7520_002714 [Penicillium odoratum]